MRTCTLCHTGYANDVAVCARDGAALPAPQLAAGEVVGEYTIEGMLGAGAF